ncbi:MAG: hypothetical protein E7269_06765 [Lachnospiraceae bacterium]|nr:hypothetical protein [Lachnospiraceae bacterium]
MSKQERENQEVRLAARRKRERQDFLLNIAAIGLMVAIAIVLIAVAVTGIKLKSGEAAKKDDPQKQTEQQTPPEQTTPEQTTPAPKPGEGHIVCIDAGHGGSDSGNTVGDRVEKTENLELASLVKASLEELGYTVVMTRDDDSQVALRDRTAAAAEGNAEVMVTLHRSSNEEYSRADTGATVYVRKDGPEDATALGNSILTALGETEITVNDVKKGFITSSNSDYTVNEVSTVTTCVVIVGNMSVEEDNNGYDVYKTQYAAAIAEGISNYIESLE